MVLRMAAKVSVLALVIGLGGNLALERLFARGEGTRLQRCGMKRSALAGSEQLQSARRAVIGSARTARMTGT